MNTLKKTVPESFFQQLEDQLRRYYPEFGDANLQLTLLDEKFYRWSRHLLVEVRQPAARWGERVLIKLPALKTSQPASQNQVRPADSADSFDLEYQALQKIWRSINNQNEKGITAVRPLIYMENWSAIVMVYFPESEHLLSLTRRAVRPITGKKHEAKALQTAALAGKLLRFLHYHVHKDKVRREAFDRNKYQKDLLLRFHRLFEFCTNPVIQEKLLKKQENILKLLNDCREPIIRTIIHGDFYPENLVFNQKGQVYTVDTTLHRFAPAAEDVAKLWVGLETMKESILFPFLRRKSIRDIQNAFLHQYFEGLENIPCSFTFFQILALLQRWVELHIALRTYWRRWNNFAINLPGRINLFMISRLDRLLR